MAAHALASLLLVASVRFIQPLDGAQVIGVTTLEVATDATEIDRVEFYVDKTLAGVVRTPPYRLTFDFGTSLQPHHIVAHVRSHGFQRDDIAELHTAALGGELITVNLVEVPLPALIAASDLLVYVYSRAGGLLQEIDPKRAEVKRSTSVGRGGSDLELLLPEVERMDLIAYLCRPANGTIVRIHLRSMESREMSTGAAPVDLALVPWGTKLSIEFGTSIIADPGKQGYDRVSITAAGVFAFDSNGGTVYRVEGRTATKIASGQTATSFVATDDALFTWDAKSAKPVK